MACRLWIRLRKEFPSVVTKMKKEDLQPMVYTHGLQLMRHLSFPVQLKYVRHVHGQNCLVSLDSAGSLRLHHEDGRVWSTIDFPGPISGLLYAYHVQHYVAWNLQELLVFDKSFNLVSQSSVEQNILCCVYDPGRNLVLSGGCGTVTAWSFSHSRRSLIWYQTLSQGMTAEDKVTVIITDTESQSTHTCYAACGTSVWEYDINDGTLQRVRKRLHIRTITDLLYSECLCLLISGSRDGTIKVWDREAQLITVYIGHTGAVTALSLSASQLILVSGSEDATLRMWDLKTQEQIGEEQVSGSLLGVDAFYSNEDCVVSYTSHSLHVWHFHHLYQLHRLLGTSVTDIRVSRGLLPSRALCVCADSTVRLISASTGDLISTLLLDREEQMMGADYCMHRETVCVLLKDGDLMKANALVNPMSVISRAKVSSSQSLPCCLILYSSVVDVNAAVTEWKQVVQEVGDKGPHEKDHSFRGTKNRFFPVVGLDDGTLCVCDWYSNQPICQTKAHCPGQVSCLLSDSKHNYIISAGSDQTVKVWRFFPYSEESLSLCMSFYCSQHVGLMCSFKTQLFVAFHDSASATYGLVQYCLQSGTRKNHPPSDDHQDQITGLCSCPRLRLVATCGRDRMVRIWNEENQLLRSLCLNCTPESLAFSHDGGELLVGLGFHIFRISLGKLLPHSYQLKVMCMESPSAVADPPVPVLESDLLSLSKEDKTRLALPKCWVQRGFEDCFHIRKSGSAMGGNGLKEQECSLLSARNQELHLIQDGKLRPCKRRKSNKETKREAMEKYLHLFYRERPPITIPEQDYFNPDELLIPPVFKQQETTPLVPLNGNRGFFTDSALGLSIHSLPKHLQTSLSSVGAVPNSALLQLLWPMEILENIRPLKKPNKLYSLITEELLPFQNIPNVEKKKEVITEKVEKATDESEELNEIPAILLKISPIKSPATSDKGSPPRLSLPPLSHKTTSASVPQRTIISRIPRHRPLQTKIPRQSSVSVQPPSIEDPLSPVPNLSEKSSAPSPELHKAEQQVEPPEVQEPPPFILQFQEMSWFPDILANVQTGYSDFESCLLQGVLQADFPVRKQLLQAVHTLHQQGHLIDPQKTFHTLVKAINTVTRTQVFEDCEFLWFLLRVMMDLFRGSSELVLELLVTCVQVHPSHRDKFLALFDEIGVQDPHGFIGKKCSSWDNWEQTENSRKTQKQTCEEWLSRWTAQLIDYLQAAMTHPKGPRTSQVLIPVRSQDRVRARRHKTLSESLSCDVTPSDVLNYYCEIQMKKEIQDMKDHDPEHGSTVLALPPIYRKRALLRLGETGTCLRRREEGDSLPPIAQSLLPGIITFINLPLNKVTLSPLTTSPDRSVTAPLTGSLRQEFHRYFILQQSYLENYY
ncbi:WD repeat-containing protein 97 isoform X2 [Mixophyes fleayi]